LISFHGGLSGPQAPSFVLAPVELPPPAEPLAPAGYRRRGRAAPRATCRSSASHPKRAMRGDRGRRDISRPRHPGGLEMASRTASRAEPSGWAVGLASFAGFMLIMIGTFQFFEGLAAIIKDQYYVVGPNYVYDLDTTAYGWIHLIWGAIMFAAGFGVLSGRIVARIVGIGVAVISAIIQFFYIPYYPIWAVLIIALDVACIWALTVYGRAEAEAGSSYTY
jgi:hypothetical protein